MGRGCNATVILLLLVLIGGWVILPLVARQHLRKGNPAALAASYAALDRSPQVPADWWNPKPFSQALLSKLVTVGLQVPGSTAGISAPVWVTEVGVLKQIHDTGINAANETTATLILQQQSSLVTDIEALVNDPDFSLEACEFSVSPNESLRLAMHYASLLACIKAEVEANSGNEVAALQFVQAGFRLRRVHPGSQLSMLHLANTATVRAARSLGRVVEKVESRARLESALMLLDSETSRPAALTAHPDLYLGDTIGRAREVLREGYPLHYVPGQKAALLFRETIEAHALYPSWAHSNLPATDPRRVYLPPFEPVSGGPFHTSMARIGGPLWRDVLSDFFVKLSVPNYEEPLIVERTAQVCYDLARLKLKTRISALEKKPAETSAIGVSDSAAITTATVKHLASQAPRDPFTSQSYLWNPVRRTFYSVGPDLVDDSTTKPYVWHRGMNIYGDIWLGRGN